jgi:ketosteroid isomerase-like protein
VSQADVDVVLEQFGLTNAREFARAMDLYADDVVLVVDSDWSIASGTYEGKAAVGEWFGDWFRTFGADVHFEITESRDLGEGLVYLYVEIEGSGRTSGATTQMKTSYLYRVADGLITRAGLFPDPDVALEAASLPEWSKGENG